MVGDIGGDLMDKVIEEIKSLGEEYRELKEIRDSMQETMNIISIRLDELMNENDFHNVKEELVSVSMVDGSRLSMGDFQQALLKLGVDHELVAEAEKLAKPKPKYKPRVLALKKPAPRTVVHGIGKGK
jgi:hypothetical protein